MIDQTEGRPASFALRGAVISQRSGWSFGWSR